MKLEDMNLKPVDVLFHQGNNMLGVIHLRNGRLSVAYYKLVTSENNSDALQKIGFDLVERSAYSDGWQLLTAQPTLGEAVLVSSLSPGDAAWVEINGRLWPGVKGYCMVTGSYQSPGTDFRQFAKTGGEFVYRCPRPVLPSEKTLREKVQKVLEDHYGSGAIANRKEVAGDILAIPEIAALLKRADHE